MIGYLQPGQGLGFTGSKQLAFGLGTPFGAITEIIIKRISEIVLLVHRGSTIAQNTIIRSIITLSTNMASKIIATTPIRSQIILIVTKMSKIKLLSIIKSIITTIIQHKSKPES